MERTHDVTAPDGRTLHVHEDGDPQGRPVVSHHGTPSGGGHYGRHAEVAREQGLRLIGYDRPGYGGSTPQPGRTVADAAADVEAILDALGVERFTTWGGSGGGPHALACAALLPGRCVAAVTLAGVAPFDAEGLDWLAGQGEDNVAEWAAVQEGREAIEAFCGGYREQLIEATPEQIVEAMRTVLSDVDAAALSGELGEYMAVGMRHALVEGVDGWVDDDFAFLHHWGFDLDALSAPVLVWQGRHDLMVPPAHGDWLAGHVPGAEARMSEEEGHISLVERRMGDVYAWLGRYTF